MSKTIDKPLIELIETPGYPYPLPPNTRLRSQDPNADIMKMGRFDIVQWPQMQLDAATFKIFKTIARPPSVLLLPTDKHGNIMLVKTLHPGRPEFTGFVAGDLEPTQDHNLRDACKRELMQETGYAAVAYHVVYFHYFVPGWEWFAYTVIAENCNKVCEPIKDIGEKTKPFFVNIHMLEGMARNEEFLYPPVLINKLLLRNEGRKLQRLLENPRAFAAITY